MLITADMKMAELILLDFQLLAFLHRMDIPLGFKEKTIQEICKEQDVDTDFFIQMANAFHDKDYLPKEKLKNFKAECLISYLRRTHENYLDYKIPEIQRQIVELEEDLKETTHSYDLIKNFFKEYIGEFSIHIDLEERTVFPYVLELSKSIENQSKTKFFKEHFDSFKIDKYLEEHNDIEEKLFDLKNILVKYLSPPVNNVKYNALLFDIFRLEQDLKDHSILEEKVLIPRVKDMEKELKNI